MRADFDIAQRGDFGAEVEVSGLDAHAQGGSDARISRR
jgi:hypothetical protein